jgi:hypothetical protein
MAAALDDVPIADLPGNYRFGDSGYAANGQPVPPAGVGESEDYGPAPGALAEGPQQQAPPSDWSDSDGEWQVAEPATPMPQGDLNGPVPPGEIGNDWRPASRKKGFLNRLFGG